MNEEEMLNAVKNSDANYNGLFFMQLKQQEFFAGIPANQNCLNVKIHATSNLPKKPKKLKKNLTVH